LSATRDPSRSESPPAKPGGFHDEPLKAVVEAVECPDLLKQTLLVKFLVVLLGTLGQDSEILGG
jgi:hypothetical protein